MIYETKLAKTSFLIKPEESIWCAVALLFVADKEDYHA